MRLCLGITSYSLHPGVIGSNLTRSVRDTYGPLGFAILLLISPFIKTVEAGAQTSLHCCLEEGLVHHSGRFYSDCREKALEGNALSQEDAVKLWQISEELVKQQN